jgi:hypothetical protein
MSSFYEMNSFNNSRTYLQVGFRIEIFNNSRQVDPDLCCLLHGDHSEDKFASVYLKLDFFFH